MENDEQVGLSDIIDILNTLDSQSGLEQNDEPVVGAVLGIPSSITGDLAKKQQLTKNSHAQFYNPPTTTTTTAKPEPTSAANMTNTSIGSPSSANKKQKPYIKILEQPDGKIVRFRYKCEGRSAGSIPGVHSTPENKTYPSIEIVGYKGEVVVVVSCVTKDPPYRPHPHNLVGKEGCKNGICTLVLNGEPLRAVFSNLGIQCVKKNDVKKALDEREELKVDPFKTKFAHKDQPSSIDLNAVRLCFQAFLKTPDGVKVLTPVVSDPIYHRKSISDLTITRLCSCSAKVSGGDEIILLCEKVTKDDIKIRLYELNPDDSLLWESFAEFQHTDIHKQTAIAFKTPPYHSNEVSSKAKVFIQLLRPSDGATGKPLPFEYYADPGMRLFTQLRRKLKRKQDLEIFQQILSLDNETIASKYSENQTENHENCSNNVTDFAGLLDESNRSNPLSSDSPSPGTKSKRMKDSKRIDIASTMIVDGDDALELKNSIAEQTKNIKVIKETSKSFDVDDLALINKTPRETPPIPSAQLKKQEQFDNIVMISSCEKAKEWVCSSDFDCVENGECIANDGFTKNTSCSLNLTKSNDGCDNDKLIKEDPPKKSLTDSHSIQPLDNNEEGFVDSATQNSLERAYENPIDIPLTVLNFHQAQTSSSPSISLTNEFNEKFHLDDVVVLTNPPAPKIQFTEAKSSTSTPEKTPLSTDSPLSVASLLPPQRPSKPKLPPAEISLCQDHTSTGSGSTSSSRLQPPSPIIIMRSPDRSPTKTPNSASPKKKKGLFSRFFPNRKSKSDKSVNEPNSRGTSNASSREPSIGNLSLADKNRGASTHSFTSNTSSPPGEEADALKTSQRVARSCSSASGRGSAYAREGDIIHIPLKGDDIGGSSTRLSSGGRTTPAGYIDRRTINALELVDIPIKDGNMELVAIADRQSIRNLCAGQFNVQLDPSVDLSEAEHFALYTSRPEGEGVNDSDYLQSIVLTSDDISRRLTEANTLQ